MDGPLGAAVTDVFQYPISVCIAAGIGVTPFASILKSIWYKNCNQNAQLQVEKVSHIVVMDFIYLISSLLNFLQVS